MTYQLVLHKVGFLFFFSDLMTYRIHRNSRGTSRLSTSSLSSTVSSKNNLKDIGVQTSVSILCYLIQLDLFSLFLLNISLFYLLRAIV